MASWDIDPAGVQGVLTKVQTHAVDLSGGLQSAVSDAQTAAGGAGPVVGNALADFMSDTSDQLQVMANILTAAVNGTVSAVNAYVQGDVDMAGNAQAAAVGASLPSIRLPNGRMLSE